mgnify:CR=1 FL=1
MPKVEKDAISGRETTGHEWDGIKELDTPLPRWWLYIIYASIVWSIGYWIVYPAWPSLSGYTKGVIGYSSRAEFKKTMDKVEEGRAGWRAKFKAASVSDIIKDQDLLNYSMAGGRSVFANNCTPCHGAAGVGGGGFPSLADDDWLWGGDAETIYTTVRYGVRAANDETRISDMPVFGDEDMLNPGQIMDVADYVMTLSGGEMTAAAKRGKSIFADECAACHGEDGRGSRDVGAPNLSDAIWLYGGTAKAVAAQVRNPKQGVMPAWENRLDPVSLKQVSVYVHSLGGGE